MFILPITDINSFTYNVSCLLVHAVWIKLHNCESYKHVTNTLISSLMWRALCGFHLSTVPVNLLHVYSAWRVSQCAFKTVKWTERDVRKTGKLVCGSFPHTSFMEDDGFSPYSLDLQKWVTDLLKWWVSSLYSMFFLLFTKHSLWF